MVDTHLCKWSALNHTPAVLYCLRRQSPESCHRWRCTYRSTSRSERKEIVCVADMTTSTSSAWASSLQPIGGTHCHCQILSTFLPSWFYETFHRQPNIHAIAALLADELLSKLL